jgi:hypothetical protein
MLSKHHGLVSKAECLYSQVFPNATIEKLINFILKLIEINGQGILLAKHPEPNGYFVKHLYVSLKGKLETRDDMDCPYGNSY